MIAKISHRVAKLILFSYGFARLAKKSQGCEISFLQFPRLVKTSQGCEIHSSQPCSLSYNLYSSWAFRKLAKILHSHAKLLDVRFLLWFSSLHTWFIWQRLRNSPKLGFFMCLSFHLALPWTIQLLPHSLLILMIKKNYQKHPKLAKKWLVHLQRSLMCQLSEKVLITT